MLNLREKEGVEGAADNNGVENVPEVATVAARVQHHAQIQYLQIFIYGYGYIYSDIFYHL